PVMPTVRAVLKKIPQRHELSFEADEATRNYLKSKSAWLSGDRDDARLWLEELLSAPFKVRAGIQHGILARAFSVAGIPDRGFGAVVALDSNSQEMALAASIAVDTLCEADRERAEILLKRSAALVDDLPKYDALLHGVYARIALRHGKRS